jgi:hypothetical protein
MANTSINLVGLDFDNIKTNLVQYLRRSDSPFKDINFEGSNISQLIDLLSYNTYLNSFYLNMVGSEMFLDTAQLRDTIVSHAKELNYVPRSFNSAFAEISFNVTPSTAIDSLLIPKGTTFTTKIGSNNYTFSTEDNLIFNASSNGTIVVENLGIYEGSYIVDSFVFDSSNTQQRFVISNPTIDTRSLSVVVVEDNGASSLPYTRALSFLGVNANSQVYFLQAAENSQYEILFGDNVIGRKPKSGSVIIAEYRVCNGELPNGASTFDIDGPIQGQANISAILTDSVAVGGAVAETNESIKYNAPRSYQNQERAVTASDYENLLSQNFPEIQAISAYGGEEANPPQYGKVFIAVDVKNADGIPELTKRKFYNFIKPRSPLSIDPVIVDPEFLFVEVDTNIKYNINTTTLKENDIKSLVLNTISTFNIQSLSDFKSTLRYSKFVKAIDDTHPSILSNQTVLTPYKSLVPIFGESYTASFDFGYEIIQNAIPEQESTTPTADVVHNVNTSSFMYDGVTAYIEDDGIGNLWLISTNQGVHTRLSKIGTVDYQSGLVSISNLVVSSFEGSQIKLYARPVSFDITSEKNVILSIRDSDIIVVTTQIRE